MQDKLHAAFFYLFAATTILPGIFVLATKDIVRAAFWLLLSLSGFAGFYVLLGADFLAVTQVIVYLGGILILILFGVMLTNRDPHTQKRVPRLTNIVPGILSAIVMIATLLAGVTAKFPTTAPDSKTFQPTAREIGVRFMTDQILAFEVASVLLLAALVGAAYVARRGVGNRVPQADAELAAAEEVQS